MKRIWKATFVGLMSFSLLGCSSNNDTNKFDEGEYNQFKQVLMNHDYQGSKNYDLQLAQDQELYTITISNPTPQMSNLQVMALPIGSDPDEMLPNFNIIEKQDLTSFYQNDKKIKINYFSKKAIKTFKVLLQYQLGNNKYQDVVKMTLP
jgi:hypothetical protein